MMVAQQNKYVTNPSCFSVIDAVREQTLHELVDRLKALEGDNLIQVILFGSVARGDSREDSDTDVFILLHSRPENDKYDERITNIAVDIDMSTGKFMTHLSPDIFDLKEYNDENRYSGFFVNLKKDGVVLYDSGRIP
jgi:predicted nucleotidyltransferase